MLGSGLEVTLLAVVSSEEQSGSNTTLSLDTRKNFVINAIEQTRNRAEDSRLQFDDIIQKGGGIPLKTENVSVKMPS
jgi:hypothetical protein